MKVIINNLEDEANEINYTCATVCSPSGISSVRNATLCTTLVASASRIILKKYTIAVKICNVNNHIT